MRVRSLSGLSAQIASSLQACDAMRCMRRDRKGAQCSFSPRASIATSVSTRFAFVSGLFAVCTRQHTA
jgi:hypothetical protein